MPTTANGALCESSDSYVMNLFMMSMRGLETCDIEAIFPLAWEEDAQKTLQIIMHTRDIRGGKGERQSGIRLMLFLRKFKPDIYLANMNLFFSKYGRYKDCIEIAAAVDDPTWELNYYANRLQTDLVSDHPSLAAKWAPTETTPVSSYAVIAKKLAKTLFPNSKEALRLYRKEVLVPLRKRLDIVETKLTENRLTEIDYSRVPAKCMLRNRTVFEQKDRERFEAYIWDVNNHKTKAKCTGIMPHELVKASLNSQTPDPVVEAQFRELLATLRTTGGLRKCISVVDVSGSMTEGNGLPINVAISLGIITSLLTEGNFHGKVIPFSTTAQFVRVGNEGSTLHEMARYMARMQWSMNTNLLSVFDLLLNHVDTADQMVDTLFIFTDMQFDAASGTDSKTIYRIVQEKYASRGVKVPHMVFWNLSNSGSIPFPVTSSDENVSMISGFSSELLKVFLEGGDYKNQFTPMSVMNEILKKYTDVILP